MFGRLVHLMDAVRDLEEDRRSSRFNPLAERPGDPLHRAARLARRSRTVITALLPRLDLPRPELVTALLTGGLRAACRRTLLAAGVDDGEDPDSEPSPETPDPIVPEDERRGRRWFQDVHCCDAWGCCDCADCCGDCPASYCDDCSGGASCCDCGGCDACGCDCC